MSMKDAGYTMCILRFLLRFQKIYLANITLTFRLMLFCVKINMQYTLIAY